MDEIRRRTTSGSLFFHAFRMTGNKTESFPQEKQKQKERGSFSRIPLSQQTTPLFIVFLVFRIIEPEEIVVFVFSSGLGLTEFIETVRLGFAVIAISARSITMIIVPVRTRETSSAKAATTVVITMPVSATVAKAATTVVITMPVPAAVTISATAVVITVSVSATVAKAATTVVTTIFSFVRILAFGRFFLIRILILVLVAGFAPL
ncbi:MAG: hypothetical protein M0P35_02790, partial [Bacteroidales bacterium]|nr:hypothetical protein [Bacteroidales bacterium]